MKDECCWLGISTFLIVFSIFTAIFDGRPYASASDVSACIVSRFVEIDNEQFSSNEIVAGESITVTGELNSRVNRELNVTLVPIVDKERVEAATGNEEFFAKCNTSLSPSYADDIAALEWQIVNASFSTNPRTQISIEPGGTVPFSVEIKSTEPGTFRLATGLIFVYTQSNGTEAGVIYLGRGQTVQVMPSEALLEKCQALGITLEECNERTILQKTPRQVPLSDEERKRIEDQQSQINNSMYMIGIGAAIAGIIAFITLRRRRS